MTPIDMGGSAEALSSVLLAAQAGGSAPVNPMAAAGAAALAVPARLPRLRPIPPVTRKHCVSVWMAVRRKGRSVTNILSLWRG